MRLIVLLVASMAWGTPAQLLDTALHQAARLGVPGKVRELLKVHSDPDALDSLGMTPVMVAVENRCLDVVKLLLPYTANLSHADNCGDTAYDIAMRRNDNWEVALVLHAALHPLRKPTEEVSWAGAIPPGLVLSAVAWVIALWFAAPKKRCPGPLVCRRHASSLCRVMEVRSVGALRARRQQHEGWTALMLAAQGGHSELAARLMQAGADPLQGTPSGKSAMSVTKEDGSDAMRIALSSWVRERRRPISPAGHALRASSPQLAAASS